MNYSHIFKKKQLIQIIDELEENIKCLYKEKEKINKYNLELFQMILPLLPVGINNQDIYNKVFDEIEYLKTAK